MFYKAVVMTELLYGSKSWNVPKAKMTSLNCFHVAVVRNLTGGFSRQLPNGKWYYLNSHHVLRAARLHKVVKYVGVRIRGILREIKDHPVVELLRQAQQQRRLPSRQSWYELSMDMELDAAAFGNSVSRDIQGAGAQVS